MTEDDSFDIDRRDLLKASASLGVASVFTANATTAAESRAETDCCESLGSDDGILVASMEIPA